MAKAEKQSVAEKLAALEKKQGVKIGSASHAIEDVTGYTAGNMVIDHLTGVGGLPKGRITEIFGDPSSGKTTIAIQAAATEQRRMFDNNEEGYILYLDHEHALDVDYMGNLGLDTEHRSFITSQPNFLEDGAEIVRDLLGEIPLKMIIWDSVGQMVPRARQEGDFDQRTSALNRARLLTGMLQMITGHLSQNNVSGVFINHLYTTIPTGYGQVAKDTTPGGKGIDFYSSLRLKTTALKKIKQEVYDEIEGGTVDRVQAVETMITVVKNKVAPNAYRTATVRLQLGHGFDNMWSAVQVLKNNKHIQASGAWNYFDPKGKENLGHADMPLSKEGRPALQGERAVLDFAAGHPEWRDRLIKIAESVLAANPEQLDSGTTETLDPYADTFEVDNR